MSNRLSGKHAFVTGGNRGIGLEIAKHLKAAGAIVTIASRSASVVDEMFAVRCDVADETSINRALAEARATHGPISVLVNNAGIAESAPLGRTTTELWSRIIATNLTGTFLCSRSVVDEMKRAGYGRILNISSIAGLGGAAYISAYCASKHGVVGLTRALALELAEFGIFTNAICPGYVETEMMAQAMVNIMAKTGASEAQAREHLAQSNPGGRIVTPEEVATTAIDLLTGTENGVAVVLPGGARA
ncbi:MAG: SDR family NAD(P)-dependent oxidoreductase [Vulcanimicrobiaceae bacterium]